MLYTNESYYLLRKPHGIASTFGQQQSLLDYFEDTEQFQSFIQKESDFTQYSSYCYLDGYTQSTDFAQFLTNQTTAFTKEQEFGLLNRLDNDTGGFLYFAKDQESYERYKDQQRKGTLNKMYLARVQGNPFFKTHEQEMIISTPIMHHHFDPQKMISLQTPEDQKKGRGEPHHVSTKIELITYDQAKNTSLLLITIHKGIRHQIRVHCKSIGSPILGDTIYGPKPPTAPFLHLWSIGIN